MTTSVRKDLASSQYRNQILHQQITTQQQPDEESEGKHKGLGSRLLELVDAGIRTQRSHSHGEHEGIYVFDSTVQRYVLDGRSIKQVLQQRVQANDTDETEGKPGNGDLTLLHTTIGSHPLATRQCKTHDDQYRSQQDDADHFRNGGRTGDA